MADGAGFSIETPAKPELEIDGGDLPQTARELRNILMGCGDVFDRDGPAIIAMKDGEPPRVHRLDVHGVTMKTHKHCRPIRMKHDKDGNSVRVNVTLPERVALLYLSMRGEYGVPPLDGITTAPILAADGSILDQSGYDAERRLWCCRVPRLDVPDQPDREAAIAALATIRHRFRTFPFSDSPRVQDGPISVVDIQQAAGIDESAFLCGLMTAVTRASLFNAPGILMTGPSISGAGTGKGLIARAIALIAFGVMPRAFTCGPDRQELDKRLAAELVEAAPMLFLDNVNGTALRSDTLASVMTERPARVRILGQTRMVELNSAAFIVITGNGLSVSEDLARRFLLCLLTRKWKTLKAARSPMTSWQI